MTDVADPTRALDREGRSLARYLTGRSPTEYVLGCYRRGRSSPGGPPDTPLDRVLLAVAHRGRPAARIADGYARMACPTGGFRRRLTLMVAILENAPDSHLELNAALTGPSWVILLRVAASVAASAACLVLGIVLLGPVDLLLGRTAKASRP